MNSVNDIAAASTQYDNTVSRERTKISGRTIGDVKLSDEAAKYYEQLKEKYSNMEFILVSKDMKEQAQAQAASFANPSKMVVLIDEEKIERMATDEEYRAQYESVIANAATQSTELGNSLSASGHKISAYGIQVNDDGTTTFFAVLDESLEAQKARLEETLEKKAEERKLENKENAKKRLEELGDNSDKVVFKASSIEELLKKLDDYSQEKLTNSVQTEAEKMVGQNFDFSV